MASITKNNTTKAKFRVQAIDSRGEDIELFFDTHIEAQAVVNAEMQKKVKYNNEFEVIDGLNRHPSGLAFRDWLKANIDN